MSLVRTTSLPPASLSRKSGSSSTGSETLWDNIEAFVDSLKRFPLWVNRDLSLSVFGGKQNYEYWQTIFSRGKLHRVSRCYLPEST